MGTQKGFYTDFYSRDDNGEPTDLKVVSDFYSKVYRLIIGDKELLDELVTHGMDCLKFADIKVEPVIPKAKLKSISENMGMNETWILKIHLKRTDPERYKDIVSKMSFALSGFKSLEKSKLLNDTEIKQLLKISVRIYKTYAADLWKWYLHKYNADSGANKDIKTENQAKAWLAHELYDYIKPFKEKADIAGNRPGEKDIPKIKIYGLIADIMNHGEEQHEKLTAKKIKWYIENYEKIKT